MRTLSGLYLEYDTTGLTVATYFKTKYKDSSLVNVPCDFLRKLHLLFIEMSIKERDIRASCINK